MATTLAVHYTNMVNNALYASSSRIGALLAHLGRDVNIDPRTGSVTMPDSTAITVGSITDGTMITGAQANTNTALTVAEYQFAIAITPKDKQNFLSGAAAMNTFAAQGADAMRYKVLQLWIDALVTGTPSQSNTLTAGKANFNAATTTELQIWLNTLLTTAATRGGDTSEWYCVMHPTTYAYFAAAIANLWTNFGFVDAGGMWRVFNTPTIAVKHPTTSHWGQVSDSCAFFVHPSASPCKLGPVEMHGEMLHPADDGTFKTIFTNVSAYSGAKIAAMLGEIKNDAS